MEINIEDVRSGDQFWGQDGKHYWTAVADCDLDTHPWGAPLVRVQHHPDGGIDVREWEPGTTITVTRPS